MSDCSGDNRLIDYSPEYKGKFGDYRDACGVFADVCTDELPEVTLRRVRETINFDPPLKE